MDMITKLSTSLKSAIVLKFGKDALGNPHKVVQTKLVLDLSLDYNKYCSAVTLFERLCEEYRLFYKEEHKEAHNRHAFQKWSRTN